MSENTIIVACPKCQGTGGKPAGWKMVNGKRQEIPAETCYYCNGEKTVLAQTIPRQGRKLSSNVLDVEPATDTQMVRIFTDAMTGHNIHPDDVLALIKRLQQAEQ